MDLTKLTAYEIIEHRPLPDLKSEGALLRHKKSGARVLLISNDDENKVFNIGFRTPTTNSTGVPHIMEHTVPVSYTHLDVYKRQTKTGAIAQFAAGGKETKKKDLASIAMSYGYVYVAQIAMGADFNQTVKAIAEAEAYPGPVSYTHLMM